MEVKRVERDRRMQIVYSRPSPEVDQDTRVNARVLYQLICRNSRLISLAHVFPEFISFSVRYYLPLSCKFIAFS